MQRLLIYRYTKANAFNIAKEILHTNKTILPTSSSTIVPLAGSIQRGYALGPIRFDIHVLAMK